MKSADTVRTRRWTRLEYERMIECGIFQPDDQLELVDGRLVVKEPQDPDHFTAIMLVVEALQKAFGGGWYVRPQGAIALDDRSEPEPDISVVPGSPRDYREGHPARAVLVVEVSKSRLRFDRARKAALYARNGIDEYWIVNIIDRVLEVHREPIPGRRPTVSVHPDAPARRIRDAAGRAVRAHFRRGSPSVNSRRSGDRGPNQGCTTCSLSTSSKESKSRSLCSSE